MLKGAFHPETGSPITVPFDFAYSPKEGVSTANYSTKTGPANA
jgi:hypothetical protein